jgi:hypothetical protein
MTIEQQANLRSARHYRTRRAVYVVVARAAAWVAVAALCGAVLMMYRIADLLADQSRVLRGNEIVSITVLGIAGVLVTAALAFAGLRVMLAVIEGAGAAAAGRGSQREVHQTP